MPFVTMPEPFPRFLEAPMPFLARDWFDGPIHRPGRSLVLLRVVVALLLLVHPVHAFLHGEDRLALAQVFSSHGLPFGAGLAWMVLSAQTAASLALLAGRFVVTACAIHMAVLAAGIVLVHAPYWYVVGGAAVEGHRGMEFNVLLLVCLAALLWGRHQPARALGLAQVGAAAILLAHPLHGFWDWRNLGGFGTFLDRFAFGHGLALVYLLLATQTICSVALLARRFVAPACLVHIFILAMGIGLVHWPDWFVVGPGADGMEYSVLLIAVFAGLALARWPQAVEARDAGADSYLG